MNIIKSIKNSRNILLDILQNEYKVDEIPEYSIDEIDKLFNLDTDADNPFKDLGEGYCCNFTLNHKHIKDHKLHVLYYKIQKNNKTKVTKTIEKLIIELYTNKVFKYTDNCIIIINENIKKTILSFINNINLQLKENFDDPLKNDLGYEKKHFGNVFIFDIDTLQFNILNHRLVPTHEVIRDKKNIDQILDKCNCSIDQLPIILKTDPVANLKLCIFGDICKITRISKTCGTYYYYRVVR